MKTTSIMMISAVCLTMTAFATCNEPCEIVNPDESQRWSVPCVPAPNDTECDAGEGCGCCVDGDCWAPTPNCPDPLDINWNFTRVDNCPCYNPCELGCVEPFALPTIDDSTCYKQCTWKPAPTSITIGYKEGLCPSRCNATYNSPGDAPDEATYCAILAKLDERIAHAQQASVNPPSSSACNNPPPESFCFSDCISRHEAVHVEQMRCIWEDMESDIIAALEAISTPFDCDVARTPEDAAAAMSGDVDAALNDLRDGFLSIWNDPNIGRTQEQQAYQDTVDCLQDMRTALQAFGLSNNWECN